MYKYNHFEKQKSKDKQPKTPPITIMQTIQSYNGLRR